MGDENQRPGQLAGAGDRVVGGGQGPDPGLGRAQDDIARRRFQRAIGVAGRGPRRHIPGLVKVAAEALQVLLDEGRQLRRGGAGEDEADKTDQASGPNHPLAPVTCRR